VAQAAFEKSLATGAASAEDKASITRTLFGIAASTNQFQKTIDYGKEMADAGTATPNDLAIIAQSYFQLKDCKNSGVWVDKAVAASRKAGDAPKENLFLFKLQCASDAGDNAAMVPILIELIRLGNKSRDWNTLLRIERQDERDDHNLLMIYRLMYDTSSMTVGTDFIEMAQLLGDAALPAEAQAVLEKAMAGGLINDQQKERTTRLLNSFKTRAEADKKWSGAIGCGGDQESGRRTRRQVGGGLFRYRRLSERCDRRQCCPEKRPNQASGRGLRVSRPLVGLAEKPRRCQEGIGRS
jgi:hypothetical protein